MKTYRFNSTASLLGFGCLAVCGSLAAQDEFFTEEELYEEEIAQAAQISDPLESINRYTFAFNDFVVLNLIDPLAEGYQAITPDPVEEGASNFFYNLKYPVRLVSNLLQGRLEGAWVETGRFVVNTGTSLGFMTYADDIDMFQPIPPEDMGQAFGSWGIGEGPYLVLPILGPSNLRDLVGYVGDRAVNPLEEPFSLIDDWNWEVQAGLSATEFTVSSPRIVERYMQMKGSAIDPYTSLKNGYTQFRRAAVAE